MQNYVLNKEKQINPSGRQNYQFENRKWYSKGESEPSGEMG
jgi:hypothetical protein